MYGELYLAGPFEARNVIRKFADDIWMLIDFKKGIKPDADKI